MKTLPLIILTLILLPAAFVRAEQIYVCNGVFKNRPCSANERGGPAKLPPVNKLTVPEDARARYAPRTYTPEEREVMDELTREGVKHEPAPAPAEVSIGQVRALTAELSNNVDELVREKGSAEVSGEVTRLRTKVETFCTADALPRRESNVKADCAEAEHNLGAAESRIAALSK